MTRTEEAAALRTRMLVLATVGFLVNFCGLGADQPALGVACREQLGLTAFQQALLVRPVPV